MSQTVTPVNIKTVVVRREWADVELQTGISEFVHAVIQAGAFVPRELPPKVMQIHLIGYYTGQVNNGGHAQFMHNCGKAFPITVADVLVGLKLIGAERQHQVLSEFAAWAARNADEAREIRAKTLGDFDRRFHVAENEASVTDLAHRCIAAWPELRIVDNDCYASAIEEIAALNPFRDIRIAFRNVQSIRHQITDEGQIAIAAACGAVEPEPEAKTGAVGRRALEIEGEQCVADVVRTSKGKRLCVCNGEGARLYEYHEPDGPRRVPGEDTRKYLARLMEHGRLRRLGSGEDIKKYWARHVGNRLSAVDAVTIQRFVKVANETQAPEAIELLLRKAGLNPIATITAWKTLETEALWMAFTEGCLVVARTFSNGATLEGFDGSKLAAITRADIGHHAAEIEAVAATMQAL